MEKINERWLIKEKVRKTDFADFFIVANIENNKAALFKRFNSKLTDYKDIIFTNFHIVKKLKIESCIQYYEWVENDDKFGIIMEYFKSQTIDSIAVLPFETIVKTIIDLSVGLNKLHTNGIIHRDIKPDNILIDESGKIKISDLDFIKFGDFTNYENEFFGSLQYAAPEQIINSGDIDGRADIYSLGVILYKLLFKKFPVDKREWLRGNNSIENHKIDFPSKFDYPKEIKSVLKKALNKDRYKRYQTIEEFAFALSEIIGLKEKNITSEYLLPAKLIGRKKIIASIKQKINYYNLIMVSGRSGIGKSMLLKALKEDKDYLVKLEKNSSAIKEIAKALFNKIDKMPLEKAKKLFSKNDFFLISLYNPFKKYFPSKVLKIIDRKDFYPLFIKMLQRVASPMTVIIDNFEYVDTNMIEWIRKIIKNPDSKIKFIVTYNAMNTKKTIEEFLKEIINNDAFSFYLNELNLTETKNMILSMFDNNLEIDGFFWEKIYYQTSGIPLFILSVIKSFYAKGYLKKISGKWTIEKSEMNDFNLSASYSDILLNNFESLDDDVKSFFIKIISINVNFNVKTIQKITQLSYEKIMEFILSLSKIMFIKNEREKIVAAGIVKNTIKKKYGVDLSFVNKFYHYIKSNISEYDFNLMEEMIALATQFDDNDYLLNLLERIISYCKKNYQYEQASSYYQYLIEKRKTLNHEERCNDYFEWGRILHWSKKMEEAEKVFHKAEELASNKKNMRILTETTKFLTWHYFTQGKLKLSLKYNKITLKNAEKANETLLYNKTIGNFGNIYFRMNNFEKAIYYYKKHIELTKEDNAVDDLIKSKGHIIEILTKSGEFDKVKKMLGNFQKKVEASQNEAIIVLGLERDGEYFMGIKNYPKALKAYKKKLSLIESTPQFHEKAVTFHKIAEIYLNLGDYSNSIAYFQKELNELYGIGNLYDTAIVYEKLGKIYTHLNLFKDAETNLNKALKIWGEQDAQKIICLIHFAHLYLEMEDYNKTENVIKQVESLKAIDNADLQILKTKLILAKNIELKDYERLHLIYKLLGYLVGKKYENEEQATEIKTILEKDFGISKKYRIRNSSDNSDFHSILEKLLSLLDPKTAYKELSSFLVKEFTADRCIIVIGDKKMKEPKTLLISSKQSQKDKKFSESVIKTVVKKKQPLLLVNAVEDSNYKTNKSIVGKIFLSIIAIPLKSTKYENAVLYVERTNLNKGVFTNANLDRIKKISVLIVPLIDKFENLITNKIVQLANNDFIIGSSKIMRSMFDKIQSVANYNSPVLIYGESGSGKEMVALAIHSLNDTRKENFVAVNCAAIPQNLAESEFFGYEKGAFTGANRLTKGKFEQAQGGTLFLDEIAELSPKIQAKLLRVFENKEITRVGGNKNISLDVRIIAATNKNLYEEVSKGNFRNDLFHRLNVITINVPALNDRREDIPVLAKKFLSDLNKKYSKNIQGFLDAAITALLIYDWSDNNVRELKNIIERAYIKTPRNSFIDAKNLFDKKIKLTTKIQNDSVSIGKLDDILSEIESKVVASALKKNRWNKLKTSKELSISRPRLDNIIKKYNLKKV